MLKRSTAIIVLCAGLLAACGGSSPERNASGTQTAPARPGNPLELPASVPRKPTRDADRSQVSVVRRWARALRAGDIEAASALWAVPSRVQNGTPVLKLSSKRDVRIFNGTLPCGSVVTSAGAAGDDFTIATVRLTRRKGANCDSGAGATARTAIRVQDGRISEWYRLPDDPDAPGLAPAPEDTPPPEDDSGSTTV